MLVNGDLQTSHMVQLSSSRGGDVDCRWYSQPAFAIGCWPKHPPRVAVESMLDSLHDRNSSLQFILFELKRAVKAGQEK
jgi:hypothetical protein